MTTTHEMRLVDTNGYTVPGAVRYRVPAAQVAATATELKALAPADAADQKAVHLEHAARLHDTVSADNQRAAARQIRATDYRVQVTPPLA
ncbi:hypothetical protein ACFC0S_16070 [Streptomyces sp. NPDC056084]|uniref:hypothetical protein n=1 Tax=unclassified Streptomyces TaxID=2593676 RepID=UPI0035D5ED30